MSMSGGSTQSITVAVTPTVVLPSRPGRKSLGVHNRNGNNNIAMISNGSQGFGEGFRVMISESGNNVVDVVESY